VRKVNFREITQREIGELYGISNNTLRSHFNELVETLDIMPCDYRYFRGDNNPLDKLVEAATMLERLTIEWRDKKRERGTGFWPNLYSPFLRRR